MATTSDYTTMKISRLSLCFFVVFPAQGSISIVYNLRVAETSKRLDIGSTSAPPSAATGTILYTFREKYNGVKHDCIAGLFTLAYAPESFFLRVDTAVGRVASSDQGFHFDRVQTDDLLFSAGYSPKLSDNMRLSFSGLLGFPTHQDTSLEFVQLGYGHYGLGAQIDGSFVYSHNHNHTIRCAARCIHFFRGRSLLMLRLRKKNLPTILEIWRIFFLAFIIREADRAWNLAITPHFFLMQQYVQILMMRWRKQIIFATAFTAFISTVFQ